MNQGNSRFWPVLALGWALFLPGRAADRLRIATYNVEGYVLESTESREAKTEASKAKVVEVLKGLDADIVGLQEIGGAAALEDLRRRLKAAGLDYPHGERVEGWDTHIQVALLSRHPIEVRRPHTRDAFLLSGRRLRVTRGILEVEIRPERGYGVTVFVAHLKSRRTAVEADEAEIRREEARILREKVDRRLQEDPRANVVVMGDMNDVKDSVAIRTLVGRGRHALVDTRPGERNGDTGFKPQPRFEPRTVTWTHYFGREDTYSRIDYILLHPNAAREWMAEESYVAAVADWGVASDHRPVVITLETRDR